MITLMFEVEMEDIQQSRHILASITAHLHQLVSNSKHRLTTLEDAEMIADQYDRTVIDSRDVLLNSLDKMIDQGGGDERSKVFTSYKELVSNAASLIERHGQRTQHDQSSQYHIQKMKEASDVCLRELMIMPSSVVNTDTLSAPEITQSLTDLKVQLKLMESNIKTIMSTITQKKKLLSQR